MIALRRDARGRRRPTYGTDGSGVAIAHAEPPYPTYDDFINSKRGGAHFDTFAQLKYWGDHQNLTKTVMPDRRPSNPVTAPPAQYRRD